MSIVCFYPAQRSKESCDDPVHDGIVYRHIDPLNTFKKHLWKDYLHFPGGKLSLKSSSYYFQGQLANSKLEM